MALDISQIVQVVDRLTPTVSATRDFGRTLFVWAPPAVTGPDNVDQMIRDDSTTAYATASEVAEDYASTEEPYRAAQTYFAQTPYPRPLLIGSRHASGRIGAIVGTTPRPNLTTIQGLGGESFTFMGVSGTLPSTGANAFNNTLTTGQHLADRLQAAIRALSNVSGVTVTAEPDGNLAAGATNEVILKIQIPLALASVSAVDHTAGLTGDAMETLGIGSTAKHAIPHAPASAVADTLDEIDAADDSWYWLCLSNGLEATDANVTSASAWTEARRKMYGFNTNAAATLTSGTSLAGTLGAAERERTYAVFSRTLDHKALSVAAYLGSTDYDGSNTVATANLASLPNTAPDIYTSAAREELERKTVNYYTDADGVGVLREGWTLTSFIDARAFVDWLVTTIQGDVFTTLRTSRRVPYSNQGLGLIRDVITRACRRGVINGGLLPGEVSPALRAEIAAATETPEFDGVLTAGYLVYVPAAATLSESDRSARRVTGIRVFANGSSAIHNVEIDLTFRS